MYHFTHAPAELARSHRNVTIAALLALAATVAIVLILAIGSNSSDAPAVDIGNTQSQSIVHPDESTVAGAVTGSTGAATQHPDESTVAGAVSGP